MLRIVTERLLARIRKDPGAKLFSVSQNDWRNPCTCPACRAVDEREGSHAGTLITFVNQVAESVEKGVPNLDRSSLAYQYTRKPPKTVRVAPQRGAAPLHHRVRFRAVSSPSAISKKTAVSSRRSRLERDRQDAVHLGLHRNFRSYVAPFPNVRALQEERALLPR